MRVVIDQGRVVTCTADSGNRRQVLYPSRAVTRWQPGTQRGEVTEPSPI